LWRLDRRRFVRLLVTVCAAGIALGETGTILVVLFDPKHQVPDFPEWVVLLGSLLISWRRATKGLERSPGRLEKYDRRFARLGILTTKAGLYGRTLAIAC